MKLIHCKICVCRKWMTRKFQGNVWLGRQSNMLKHGRVERRSNIPRDDASDGRRLYLYANLQIYPGPMADRALVGYPGGAILPVFDAIYNSTHFEFILPRHEQGAGHMAQGYARASGRVGVVLVTSGPGMQRSLGIILLAAGSQLF